MPWIRFERWNYLNALSPHVAIGKNGRRYLWDGSGDGSTFVPNRDDAASLLSPANGKRSPYAVAWERYGVKFDAAGNEIPVEPHVCPSIVREVHPEEDEDKPQPGKESRGAGQRKRK